MRDVRRTNNSPLAEIWDREPQGACSNAHLLAMGDELAGTEQPVVVRRVMLAALPRAPRGKIGTLGCNDKAICGDGS